VRAYWRNAWFADASDGVLDTIAEGCGQQATVGTAVDLHHMGGAFARVPEDATAFPDRSADLWLNIYGFWSDQSSDVANIAWVKGFSGLVQPHAMATRYVNFMGHEDDPAAQKALAVYGRAKLDRLSELKRRYDPENLFRINHNIPPTA
jgi:hypothetical protein